MINNLCQMMIALPQIFLSTAAQIPSVAGRIWFGETELPSQFISVGELSLWVGATKIFVDGAIYRPCRFSRTDCSVQMMDQFEVLC